MIQLNLRKLAPVLALAAMTWSCNSSKQVTIARDDIQGNWTLDRVSTEGIAGNNVKLTLLDEGTEACLTGSTWTLPFNGNGSYTINSSAAGCSTGERKIVWSYQKTGDDRYFQYKRLEQGVKAKNIQDGYKFKIISATKTDMVLQSEVAFEGKSVFINYSFLKR